MKRETSGNFAKGVTKPENSGRKKGTPNKKTIAVKKALHEAFENAGGVKTLVKFAKTHPAEFYRLWAKTAPREINADITSGGESFAPTISQEAALLMIQNFNKGSDA